MNKIIHRQGKTNGQKPLSIMSNPNSDYGYENQGWEQRAPHTTQGAGYIKKPWLWKQRTPGVFDEMLREWKDGDDTVHSCTVGEAGWQLFMNLSSSTFQN